MSEGVGADTDTSTVSNSYRDLIEMCKQSGINCVVYPEWVGIWIFSRCSGCDFALHISSENVYEKLTDYIMNFNVEQYAYQMLSEDEDANIQALLLDSQYYISRLQLLLSSLQSKVKGR